MGVNSYLGPAVNIEALSKCTFAVASPHVDIYPQKPQDLIYIQTLEDNKAPTAASMAHLGHLASSEA